MNTRSLTRFVLLLAIIAVMLRSFIPVGYMPEMNNGKIFQMTICTMNGPSTVTVDEKFHPVSHSTHVAKETCPFSILTHSAFNSEIPRIDFDTPYQIAALQQIIAQDQFVRLHVVNPVAQPRAPPVMS